MLYHIQQSLAPYLQNRISKGNRTDGKVNTGFVPRKLLPLFYNILYLNYNIGGFSLSRGLKIDSTPKIVMDLLTAFSLCSGEFFILFKSL